jgi:hypothetical protein
MPVVSGLQTFGPKEQDLAALALARDKLMNIGGLAALKEEGLSPPVRCSFPRVGVIPNVVREKLLRSAGQKVRR